MKETTNKEILGAINKFADKTEKRFSGLENRVGSLEKGLGEMRTEMVTKDYLVEKLFDLRGDIISVVKKEDVKMGKLVEILTDKKIITTKDAQAVLSMEPFAKLFPQSVR
ncbi:hypothetical protein HQ544_03350 [Candidatus Falkowbacteria bacterium]|nr:hypothetical protein [Candidatus Falkowbacteria bacterium]